MTSVIYFVYSAETASSNIAAALRGSMSFKEVENFHGMRCFSSGESRMIEVGGALIHADFLDSIINGLIVFLGRHSSSMGIPAFTVHATGNWSDDSALGGRPKMLSTSSPLNMLKVLKAIDSINNTGIHATYEATHHGPFLNQHSFFVELGGNEDTVKSVRHAELLANAVAASVDADAEYDKIAVGIGGTHYPEKFTRLALDGRYAFSHIMSKHYIDDIDMLEGAFERSDIKADVAVIEWKGIKAADRENILRELDRLGIDYAKV